MFTVQFVRQITVSRGAALTLPTILLYHITPVTSPTMLDRIYIDAAVRRNDNIEGKLSTGKSLVETLLTVRCPPFALKPVHCGLFRLNFGFCFVSLVTEL